MMQPDHLPVWCLIEDRTAGTAGLSRRTVVDQAPFRLGWLAARRALVVEQLVILQGERKLAAFRMANYVDALVIVQRRQAFCDRNSAL